MNHVGTVLTYHLQKKIRWIGPKMTELRQIFCDLVNFLDNRSFGQIRHWGEILSWGDRPDFFVLIYITNFVGNHFCGPSGPTDRELRGLNPSPILNKLAQTCRPE